MKKLFTLTSFILCLNSHSQNSEDSFQNIEPPPTPIDSYILPSIILAVLILWTFYYHSTLKKPTNENQ